MARVELLSDSQWLAIARDRLRADGDGDADQSNLRLLGVRAWAAKGEYTGFIADSLPVRVRVQVPGGAEKELAFFMKTVPTDNAAHMQMATEAFVKEVGLYADLFPRMRELPPREKMAPGTSPWAPRTFFTRPDLLVMEDLIEQGFLERDRREPFDFEHVAITLEFLGRFHASGLLLEEERRRESGSACTLKQLFPEFLDEILYVSVPKKQMQRWFGSAIDTLQSVVKLIPKYKSSPDYERIVDSFPNVHQKMVNLMQASTKFRNVMNHGDLWPNNILFKYGEDDQPVDVRLLDFQGTRYCPPAVDIMSLLYLTTLPSLRRERGGELLRGYHAALADSLQRGGADAQRLLPWDELVASCDEYHDVGRIIAPCYHHVILVTPEVVKEQVSPENFEKFLFEERYEIVELCFRDDEYYREKVTQELCELVDSVILTKDSGFWKRATSEVR